MLIYFYTGNILIYLLYRQCTDTLFNWTVYLYTFYTGDVLIHILYGQCTNTRFIQSIYYTYLQNKRMRRCGVAPPPIIFERLKLPQQIIYRRKENLSESPNHQKYWENILVSRFYEQFSRNRRNLGHFRKFEKISYS